MGNPAFGSDPSSGLHILSRPWAKRLDVAFFDDAELRQVGADDVRDIGRGEVGVVLLGHPLVGVPELAGDDGHGDAAHGQPGTDAVPQYVKADCGLDVGGLAGLSHRPVLVRLAPASPVAPEKHSCVARAPQRCLLKEGAALVREGPLRNSIAISSSTF